MDLPVPPSPELPSIPAWKTTRWGISWRSRAPEGGSSQLPFLAEPHPWGLIPKEGLCCRSQGFQGLSEGETPDLDGDGGGWSSVRRSELSKRSELCEIGVLQGLGAP